MPENRKIYTLGFVFKPGEILLGLKKIGWGTGKWNGFGGKVEPDESVELAAKREVKEECGIEVSEIRQMAYIDVDFQDGSAGVRIYVFRADAFEGNPSESEEMKPQWFKFADIPYKDMWVSDAFWLPTLIANKKFKGTILFDSREGNKIIEKNLVEVDSL